MYHAYDDTVSSCVIKSRCSAVKQGTVARRDSPRARGPQHTETMAKEEEAGTTCSTSQSDKAKSVIEE